MSQMKGVSNWMIGQNSQCSCFGSLKTNQERFLANYNAFTHPYKVNQLNHVNSHQAIGKYNSKKSLKKAFIPLFSQNARKNNKNTQINNKQKITSKLAKSRSLKKATSSLGKKPHIFSHSTTYQHSPILFSSQFRQQTHRNITFNHNNHTLSNPIQIRAVSSLEYSARYNYPPCQFTTPIKISYKDPSITHNQWNSQPTKKEIYSSKQFYKQEQVVKRIDVPQHFSSLRTVREPINFTILSKSQSFRLIPPSTEPPADLNIEKCDTSMIQNSIQINITQAQPPQNPPLTYSWDKTNDPTITNTLTIHKSQQLCINTLVPKLPSLKKMDDVMQICSQADSQEDSNSDKESIVLGRLNQYSSMLQQKNKVETVSSLIDKKVQSRLARIGSLNSTIGHCQSMRSAKE